MSLGLLATPTVTICKVAKMVFNVAPGNFYLSQYLEYQEANGTSATVEALAGLAGGTDAAFVTTVLTNLGLADDAGASAFLTSAVAASGRGAALEAAISALDGVAADDATYGAAKTAFDTATVTSVTYSTNAANNSTDAATLAAAVDADAVTAGQSFSLTDSSVTGKFDNFTGTTGDDTFSANANNLLLTGDVVDGGAGEDTISSRYTVTAATTVGAQISNVENHVFRIDADGGAADAVSYDTADMTGITSITLDRMVNSGSTADPVVTVSGSNYTTAVATTIKGGDSGADNSAVDITLSYNSVSGSSDEATVTLDGAAANVVTIAGIETLNLVANANETSVSSSGASDINSLQATAVKTLNISGSGAVSLSGTAGSFVNANLAATVTVNASENTGGVTFSSEANTLTFTGGSGADTVYMANTLTAVDGVNGGDGRDTLGLTNDVSSTIGAVVSNFEILDLVDVAASQTFDMDDYANSSFDTIALSGAMSADVTATVNDLVDGGTILLGGKEAITATDDMTVTVKNAGVAGQNNNTLNIETTGTAAVDFGTLTAANIENINITAGGAATGNSIAVLTAAAARNLTVTGSKDLEITAFTSSAAITNYDTSGMTGDFVMGAAGQSTSATLFTGGDGNDTFIGNSGDDIFNAGAGDNTLTGGAGDDTFNLGSGVDNIAAPGDDSSTAATAQSTTGSAAIATGDTLTFGNGVDIINSFTAGAGGDTLDVVAALAGSAPTTLIGETEDALTDDTAYFASGTYTASTGVFTIAAAGTGADTLIVLADATIHADTTDIMENDGMLILVGVDSDDLVAGNFV